MSEQKPNNSGDVNFRKKWDKEEYERKAKEKDADERERMQENEKLIRQGKRPRIRPKEDLPKATQMLQQRDTPLNLDKNLNQTVVVANPGGRGAGQPGFYCDLCNRNYRDTTGYLDHINSRAHLRKLGQTTNVERSTLEQVRQRIATLREQTREKTDAKLFDFEKRLADIKKLEADRRVQKKLSQRIVQEQEGQQNNTEEGVQEMAMAMGFGGFGTTKQG